ncbi:MAG: GNAT family N-acetyltransferase [Psychroserpens sp.]|nr:GNAT family N-acetyltransferase [Psychroserpens sp.]
MIRKATLEDIESIMEITRACAQHMIDQNIFQWNAFYPNKEAFEVDIERDELFVLDHDSTVIGCVVISTFMDEVYQPVQWLTPSINNIYIHRLAVNPKHQGQGHAQQLMEFAEDFARSKSFASIRLDTFSQNKRNQKFYELRGYQKLESVFFPKQSQDPFFCYELIL